MAERPKGYGFTAEVKGKIDGKYDENLAKEAREWIEFHVGEPLHPTGNDPESMHEALKDGRILCKLMNCLDGGDIKINASNMAFKRMENIGKFLEAAAAYGVSKTDSFQTVDLYEATNMPQVIYALHALGRKAASKGKRGIGPKESQENKREFSDEQLRAGEGVIGLQMGTNKGASQAGQHFGRPRQIRDS